MAGASAEQDPATAYGQIDQGQRQQVAQAFVERFRGVNDPRAQQFARIDPKRATPQQVAEMHQYAAQNQPEILQEVMDHPIMMGMLTAFALHEVKQHEQRH